MKTFVLLVILLVIREANGAPSAAGLSKWFGGNLGVDTHMGPPDMTQVFNWFSAIDLGHWYEREPSQGVFQAQWIQNELAVCSSESPAAQYEIASFLWGNHGDPKFNEPSWLSDLPPDVQVEEFIKAMQWLDQLLPPGSKVNLIDEPLHTTMSTVEQALGGSGSSGWDGLIQAVKLARQYMPHQLIGVLDYNIECNDNQSWDPGATTRFIQLVNTLQAAGANVDYISCEGDFLENTSADDLSASMKRMHDACNLPIEISQLDIDVGNSDSDQLGAVQRIFTALWQSPYVVGVAYWATDGGPSQSNYPGHTNDALWNQDGSHRPALDWIISYIQSSNPPNVWSTTSRGTVIPAPTSSPTPCASPATSPSPSATPTPVTTAAQSPSPAVTPSPTPEVVATPVPPIEQPTNPVQPVFPQADPNVLIIVPASTPDPATADSPDPSPNPNSQTQNTKTFVESLIEWLRTLLSTL